MVAIRSREEVYAVSESLKPTPPCHDGVDRLSLIKCTVSTGTPPSFPFVFATWPALLCVLTPLPRALTPALDNIAITIRALGSAIEVTPDFDSLFVFTRHLRSLYEHLNYEDDDEGDASSATSSSSSSSSSSP
jgi:hypothetical protein